MKIPLLIVFLAISDIITARLKRSIGGEEISIDDAPFFVSVKRNLHHKCGGTLISPTHVLTAAHCVIDHNRHRFAKLMVISGTDRKYMGGFKHGIAHILYLPGYVSHPIRDVRDDLSIIVLSKSIESHDVRLARLPTAELNPTEADFISFKTAEFPSEDTPLCRLKIFIHHMLFPWRSQSDEIPNDPSVLIGKIEEYKAITARYTEALRSATKFSSFVREGGYRAIGLR